MDDRPLNTTDLFIFSSFLTCQYSNCPDCFRTKEPLWLLNKYIGGCESVLGTQKDPSWRKKKLLYFIPPERWGSSVPSDSNKRGTAWSALQEWLVSHKRTLWFNYSKILSLKNQETEVSSFPLEYNIKSKQYRIENFHLPKIDAPPNITNKLTSLLPSCLSPSTNNFFQLPSSLLSLHQLQKSHPTHQYTIPLWKSDHPTINTMKSTIKRSSNSPSKSFFHCDSKDEWNSSSFASFTLTKVDPDHNCYPEGGWRSRWLTSLIILLI